MSEKQLPSISVIVCAFNEEKLIQACLSGIIGQVYPPDKYEVLVIDDESTDDTFKIVADFISGLKVDSPHVRLSRIQHGGLSVARNSGVLLSNGEIIAFIDGDAVPEPSWLSELAKPFMAGADYAGGRINLLNTGSWVARFLQRTRHRQYFGPSIYNDHFIGCNMAFRKGIFDVVGGFHENFVSRGDESTLHARIVGQFRYLPAPEAVVLHERPESFAVAIKVTWKSATLSRLAARASGKKVHPKRALLFMEQVLMACFPILLGLLWLKPGLLAIPLMVSASALVRRLYLRPLNRAIAGGLIQEYGLVRGIAGHILYCFIFNMLEFFGGVISPWLHREESIIPPKKTALSVLRTIENTSLRSA